MSTRIYCYYPSSDIAQYFSQFFPLTDGIQNGSYYSSEWMGPFIHTWVHQISKLGSGSLIYSIGNFYQLEDGYRS